MDEQTIIARWIEPNPHRPGADEMRIAGTGIPVWALIGYLPAAGDNLDLVAKDYNVPLQAVQAAVAYYRKHKDVIDARLATNAAYAP